MYIQYVPVFRLGTSNKKTNKPPTLLPTRYRQYKETAYSTERHKINSFVEKKSLHIRQSKANISGNLLKRQFSVANESMDSKSSLYGSKSWLP